MSGLSQNTLQNEQVRNQYNQMVLNAIKTENSFHTGEPDNTIQSFGALYSMREEMQDQVGFGKANIQADRQGGFLPLLYMPLAAAATKIFGGEKKTRDDEHLEGGMSFLELAMPGYAIAKKIGLVGDGKPEETIHIDINSHKNEPNDDEKDGGMVLSKEAQEFHKKRAGRKRGGKKCGGEAVTGSDFSGADIINSNPLINQGPNVGSRASLGNKKPNNNAGVGVQSWTEYPNKSLSKADIKEATATVRDIENGFPVANKPSVIGLRKRGRPSKKQGGFLGPLATVLKVGKAVDSIGKSIPFLDEASKGITGLFGLGKDGGAAVASPDVDEGKRAPIVSGIVPATQIDGYQDPRTTGMASQASKSLDGGKKKRNRKPMTAEQKKAFAERMKQAKLKKKK